MSSFSAAADKDGDAPITAIPPEIIQSHILNRLDGRTLAVASCVSDQFLSLCNDDLIWKRICNSTWPSTADPRVAAAISDFPSGYRSFYPDASPALRRFPPRKTHQTRVVPVAPKLISAVDIKYDDVLIHSNVLVTDTFLSDDFMMEISDLKEVAAVPLNLHDVDHFERAQEHLRLSWILIDPVKRRAINLSSLKAVGAKRHSLTNDIQLRYASMLVVSDDELVMCLLFVHCTWKEDGGLRVKDVYVIMKASDGTTLTAGEGLRTLEKVIEEKRWKSNFEREKENYENFCVVNRQRCRREINVRRASNGNMVCKVTSICIHFAFGMYSLCRRYFFSN